MEAKTVTRSASLILLFLEAKIDQKNGGQDCDHGLLQLGAASAARRLKTEAGFVWTKTLKTPRGGLKSVHARPESASLNYSQTCRSTVAKTLDCCVTKVYSFWRPCIVTNSVADPGCSAFFGPWIRDPGWGKIRIPDPRSGTRDKHISDSLVTVFRVIKLKFVINSVLGSRIRDPGWNNPDPGYGMEKSKPGIRDKHPGGTKFRFKYLNTT